MQIVIQLNEKDIIASPQLLDIIGDIKKIVMAKAATESVADAIATASVARDIAQSAPTPAPVAVPVTAPTAPPQAYTLEQLSIAGAALMDAGKTNELINLLNNTFGVATLQMLPAERYNDFAVALRGLGAQI